MTIKLKDETANVEKIKGSVDEIIRLWGAVYRIVENTTNADTCDISVKGLFYQNDD